MRDRWRSRQRSLDRIDGLARLAVEQETVAASLLVVGEPILRRLAVLERADEQTPRLAPFGRCTRLALKHGRAFLSEFSEVGRERLGIGTCRDLHPYAR